MENSLSHTTSNFTFWRKVVFILIFFITTPVAISTSIVSLLSIQKPKIEVPSVKAFSITNHQANSGVQVYASLPTKISSISGEVIESDARSEIIRQYLEDRNSPLEPYSKLLVDTADKYGIDWRLLVAISNKESNVCKIIPPGSYNCWGWGIHSEGSLGFESFEEGIETVSRGLKENYIDKGYETIPDIMTKYTPNSPEGAWAIDVQGFIDKMQ